MSNRPIVLLLSGVALVLISLLLATSFSYGVGTVAAANETVSGEPEATPIDIETDRMNIYLFTQKTAVDHNETVVLIHSVTNYITNDNPLTVQLILEAPQGSEVFAVSGVNEGSGSQFTTTTTLEPGGQDNLRIHARLNEPGNHEIRGQVVYYFDDDKDSGDGVEVTIPVEQRPPPPSTTDRVVETGSSFLSIVPNGYQWVATSLENRATTSLIPIFYYGLYILLLLPVSFAFSFGLTFALMPLMLILESDSEVYGDLAMGLGMVAFAIGFVLFFFDFLSSLSGTPETLLIARYLAGLLTVAVISGLTTLAWFAPLTALTR